jgi:hypothetical protein
MGAAAGDFNNDGCVDLYVTNLERSQLFRNDCDGTFTDVSARSRAEDRGWSVSASFVDYDRDGWLDLFVGNYVYYSVEGDKPCLHPVGSLRDYCPPSVYRRQPSHLYHNNRDGTFTDVTAAAGMGREFGPALGVSTADFNNDGWMDVYVANDSVESFLWMSEKQTDGSRRFREKAEFLGVKYGTAQNPQAGMGATVADINRDGNYDVFKTNFSQDYNNMYMQQRLPSGAVYFRDKGLTAMGQAVFYDLSWACGWYDFDNDRDLDLYVANGHVYKEVDQQPEIGSTYDMFNALFESVEPEVLGFREIGRKAVDRLGPDGAKLDAGDGMDIKACSRGTCFADVNNDGRMDLLVTNMNAAPNLIVNDSTPGPDASWAKIVLRQAGLNRDALGASVVVTAGKVVQHFPVIRASSFLGSDDPRLHVGLGNATTFDVKVTWPGAERAQTTFTGLEAGRLHVLDRESGRADSQTLKTFAYPFPK